MFSGNNSNTPAPADSFTNFLNWQHQQQVIAAAEPHFDWGALAKQWIQSNATLCQPAANQIFSIATHQAQQPSMSYQNRIPDAPPPPTLSYQNDRQPQIHQPHKSPMESHQQELVHNLNNLDQEQGEADMEVEKEDDIIEPNVANNAQFSNLLNTSGAGEWLDPSASMAQSPQINFANPWQWQNNLPPPQLHIPTIIGPGNISNSLGNLNSNLSMSITPLIKPEDADEKLNQIDAAKRKTLPAWIREGLEKMEREKQKQMEKEKERELKLQSDENDKKLLNVLTQSGSEALTTFVGTNSNMNQVPSDIKSIAKNISTKTDSDSSSEYDGQQKYKTNRRVSTEYNDDNTRKHSGKSYEELVEELMIAVKRTLTEILLEVTNSEIQTIATEEYKRHKLKASSAQVFRKSALSSITGKLGLGAYGGSSDSDESDGNNSEQENDSDAELRENIRTRQNAFKAIAKEIEERIMYEEAKREQRNRDREERHETSRNSHYFNSNSGAGAAQSISSSSRKKYSKDFGETHPEKKSYFSNGKSHLKKRTSRFSDNNDSKSKPSSSQYLVPTPSSSSQILLANVIQKDKEMNPTNLLQKLSKDNKNNKSSSSSPSSDTESSSSDSNSSKNSHAKKLNKIKSKTRKNDRSGKDDNQHTSNSSSIKKIPNDSSRSDDRYESSRSNRRNDEYLQRRKRRQNSSDSDDYHRRHKQSSSSRSYSKRSKSRGHSSRGDRSRSRSRSNYSSSSRRYDRY